MSPSTLTASTRATLLKKLAAAETAGDLAAAQALRADYVARLPRVGLSRDPLTGAVVERAFDAAGLDGPFWDYADSARPSLEPEPPTLVAWTGALAIDDAAVPDTRFLVKPGPGAPFVVPRLLALPGVVAVISQVEVGGMTGWCVCYFAQVQPTGFIHFNDWGSDRSWYRLPDGENWGWERNAEDLEELDFNLAGHVRKGSLQWIAPGDAKLEVRSGAKDFPYGGIKGTRGWQRLQFGQLSAPVMKPAQRAIGPVSLRP